MLCRGPPRDVRAMTRPDFPRTLAEFRGRFASEGDCRRYLVACRWPDGFRCPRCGEPDAYGLSSIGDDGAHFRPALAVEGVDGLVDGVVEPVGVAEGAVGQVVVLQVAPGALDVVQLGRVLGQPLDPYVDGHGEPSRFWLRPGAV